MRKLISNEKSNKKNHKNDDSKKKKIEQKNSDHDSIFRKSLEHPETKKEFLEIHLPVYIKDIVDIESLQMQKESFIDSSLKKSYCDLLFASPKNQYIYILVEHQSSNDPMMAFRLLKYMFSICDRHINQKPKPKYLPLIYPLLIYNGKKKYTARRNIWELFANPQLAKECFTGDYQLIDLPNMSNDETLKTQNAGMMQYLMKNIHARDMIQAWEELAQLLQNKFHITLQDIDSAYLISCLCYTSSKINEEQKPDLGRFLKNNLKNEDVIMTSLAEVWKKEGKEAGIAEGMQQGMQQGIHKGMQQGMQQGMHKGMEQAVKKTATNMILKGLDVSLISSVTGLSIQQVQNLKTGLGK